MQNAKSSGESGGDLVVSLDLLESVPVPLLVAKDTGEVVFTNQSLDRLFGYEPGELAGSPVEVLVPPEAVEDHPGLRGAYMQVPYQRTMGSGRDLQGVTKGGSRVEVEIGLSAVDLEGETHVLASVMNVAPLRVEQEKTRLAIDAAASGMIMVNAENRIVLVNEQAVEMFGYREEELLGSLIDVLVPERYQRNHGVYRGSYTAVPSRRSMGGDRRLHGRRSDGTEFPLEIGLTPIDDHGELMIMATVIDISARIRAEEEIEQRNADLTRLNEELAQFAYSASHDLKAPLVTLEGVLLCLKQDLEEGELGSALENADRAQGHAGRMAQLVEGILGMARSENLDSEIGELDLREVIETLRFDLESVLLANGVELRNEVAPGTTLVSDRRRVVLMLENLITNGAKFANQQLDERYVQIEARPDGNSLLLVVTDNGIGIPEEAHDHVFTMFRRFNNHDQDGTGLGLAMVRQHVERLGGTITFSSTSAGTVFTLRLPSTERRTPHEEVVPIGAT